MNKRGIVYVAYGERARLALRQAVKSAHDNTDLPITVIGDHDPHINGVAFARFDSEKTGRWAKLNLDTLSPYPYTLYLDADTCIVSRDIARGFSAIAAGYDIAIAPSENQASDFLSHSTLTDRDRTRVALSNPDPLQLQAGMMFFARNDNTAALFEEWRNEWKAAGGGQDQGALLRALDKAPVKLWLLSLDWNSRHGTIVEHHFGEAR